MKTYIKLTEKQKELHKMYGGMRHDPMTIADRNVCTTCGHLASHFDYCPKKKKIA